MDFQETIKEYKKRIDEVLEKYLETRFAEFPDYGNKFVCEQYRLAKDLCLSNGKRLRPLFTIMAYRAVGGKNDLDIMTPALAFEIYHNYTLVHDDIYDEDRSRRGRTANHAAFEQSFATEFPEFDQKSILYRDAAARFGVVAGLINGKYLHTLSSLPILESDISDAKKAEGMRLHQSVSIFDNTGQAIDLDFELKDIVAEEDYYNMVICKTGRLFQVSVEWGVVLGEGTLSQRQALCDFVGELAIAFQIKDDLMDIEEGTKGRGLGSDIRQRKKTLLAIHALNNMASGQKVEFFKVFGNKTASENEIKKAIQIMRDCGSLEYCKQRARERISIGLESLERAEPALGSEEIIFFKSLADYMVDREK